MAPSKILAADDDLALRAGTIKGVVQPVTCINPTPNVEAISGLELLEGFIPVIDMEALHGPRRSDIIKQLGHACQHYGFFMVKNHGIPETVLNDIIRTAREFFRLPDEERMKYFAPGASSPVSLATAFQDKVHNILVSRESLKFQSHPADDYANLWPSNPSSFRKSAAEYSKAAERTEIALTEAIFEGLGVERVSIDKILNKHGQLTSLNYYPRCEKSKLGATYGLRPHTDPTTITILLPDDVPGLEVLKDDKWLCVKPVPNTLVVIIGDLVQAVSNCQYKSLIHRVVVNPEKERISIATYCYPSNDSPVGPPKELIDDNHPAIYKDFTYQDFFSILWKQIPAEESRLDLFKVSAA